MVIPLYGTRQYGIVVLVFIKTNIPEFKQALLIEGTGDWHVMKCLDSKLDVKRERTLVLEENIITCAHDRILVLCNVF